MALTKMNIAILATDGVERSELSEPRRALEAAGATVSLISERSGSIETYDHLTAAGTERVDMTVGEADMRNFDALVLPGGVANPDALRTCGPAVDFVRTFVESGKPVAAICHAPWLLIEAGVVAGRDITSWPSLKTDLENAGAHWTDQEVVRDGNLLTSRRPDDLPAFSSALLELIEVGQRQPRTEAGVDDALDDSFPASDPPSLSGPALSPQ